MKDVEVGYRLNDKNVIQYLREVYGNASVSSAGHKILKMDALLQNDYGLPYDCTLTSLTQVTHFLLNKRHSILEIYDKVEATAKKYFYNGETTGTYVIFVKKILDEVLTYFFNTKFTTKTGYFKGIGYTWNRICKEIDNGHPLILSMWKDGRGYYKDHSITIIGYINYKVGEKKVRILVIHDNWYKDRAYIDFERLNTITSINYV